MSSNSTDPGQPPGWYPDPRKPRRWYRYWDGYQWTDHTQAPPPGKSRRVRFRHVAIGTVITTGLVVFVVMWAILHNHQQIQSVSKDGTITFYDTSQIQDQQSNAQQQLHDLQQQAQASGAASPAQPGVDIAGNWIGSNGLTYVIEQYGGAVVVQEYCSCGGITAVGEGGFDGTVADVRYRAVDGSTGAAEFTLTSPDSLVGQFHNDTSGTTSGPVALSRQGP